ncbi:MAG: DUF4215 domain-containing protein [Proteobacteria bacterium]|nr:DUF4215 domain-containing protein [Pseudomonadota bacterium]
MMKKTWLFALAALLTFGCAGSDEENLCGNGQIDEGEQCDDGNNNNGDGCSSLCKEEQKVACGNGTKEPGEQCDDGNNVDGDGCSSTCQIESVIVDDPVCGNGTKENDEECDDGNKKDGDGCSSSCKNEVGPFCGDGKVTAGEQCDDGNNVDGDGCSSTCQTEKPVPVCGNDIVEDGEVCDGESGLPTSCSAWKPTVQWKDGTLKPSCEQCQIVAGACSAVTCGNGVIDEGETCDPKKASAFTCSDFDNTKTWKSGSPVCSSDSCALEQGTCKVETCGNGTLETEEGEQCEIGSAPVACSAIDESYVSGNATCNAKCQYDVKDCATAAPAECGNGEKENGETCDWGDVTVKDCNEYDPSLVADPELETAMARCNGCVLDTSECKPSPESGLLWCQTMEPIRITLDDSTTQATVNMRYSVGADVEDSRIVADLAYGKDLTKIVSTWAVKDATKVDGDKAFTATLSKDDIDDFGNEAYYSFRISVDGGENYAYCKTNETAPDTELHSLAPVTGTTDEELKTKKMNAHTTGYAMYSSTVSSNILAKFSFDSAESNSMVKTYNDDMGGAATITASKNASCNSSGGCYTSQANKCFSLNGWSSTKEAAIDGEAYLEIAGLSTTGATGINLDFKAWRNATNAATNIVVMYKTTDDGEYVEANSIDIKKMDGTKELVKQYFDYNYVFTSAVDNQEKLWIKLVPYGGNGFIRLDDIVISKDND